MENEIWKDIEGYEGKYQVSNFGRVKSFISKFKKQRPFIILKQHPLYTTYFSVLFRINYKQERLMVHRIVAKTFIPNPDNKREVHHKDFNKQNNHVDNLEWVSSSENKIHNVTRPGYVNSMQGRTGSKSPQAKKIIQMDKEGNIIKEWDCITTAGKALRVSISDIVSCAKGKKNVAGYFKWKYA